MADKIQASSAWLDQCSRQIAQINSAIASATGMLSSIHLRRDEGGNLRTRLSVSLAMNGRSFSGSTAADDIRQLQAAASSLSQSVGRLSDSANKASQLFKQAEDTATRTITSISGTTQADIYQDGSAGGRAGTTSGGGGGHSFGPNDWKVEIDPRVHTLLGPTNPFINWTFPAIIGPSAIATRFLDFLFDENNGFDWKGGTSGKKTLLKRPDIISTSKDGYKGPSFGHTIFQAGQEEKKTLFVTKEDKITSQNGMHTSTSEYAINKGVETTAFYGGLYQIKHTADGKEIKTFTPGVKAEKGFSYSALSLKQQDRFGTDNLAVFGESNVNVLRGEVKGEGEFGLIDGKLAAHGSLKAEGILAEAKAKAGVDVAGVKGSVEGTVNFGIGFHGDIGLHDHQITCDAGIAFGPGVSVKFNVDYSGLVEKAGVFMGNVYHNVQAFRGATRSAIKLLM